jgi:hypothetical protein
MAPAETTTLRVPIQLRDEIARLAEERGTTMLDVVTDAVHRLSRDQWWDTVRDVFDQMTPEDVAAYHTETSQLDDAAADGLRAG